MIPTYQKRGRQFLYTGKELTMRWQVLLLTAMSITVALSLGSCRPPSGAGQGIDHGQMMQGASELQKALELPGGVPPGMRREISPLGEQPTATKIKDEIKHSDHKLLEDAIDHGPKAYSAYKVRDYDLDGHSNFLDNCPYVFNGKQKDSDADSYGDACDLDLHSDLDENPDSDSRVDSIDNCPTISNSSQVNLDRDNRGDACDSDMDGDGVLNANYRGFDPDMNGDGDWYTSDPDNDGDGVLNAYDHFDWDPAYY